jgi:hypothetical protein
MQIFKKIQNIESSLSFVREVANYGGWIIMTTSVSGGVVGAYLSYSTKLLNQYAPYSLYLCGILASLLIALFCLTTKWVFRIEGKTTKYIPLKNTETYVVIRMSKGKPVVEDSKNTYTTYSTINSSKLGEDTVSSGTIFSMVCIFHDYIRISNVVCTDSEKSYFNNLVVGNYTHMHANLFLFDLDDGKSVRVDFK